MITINFDGACEWYNGKRNPGGLATYGWIIKKDGQQIAYGYGEVARGEGATNNVAEYTALIEALKALKDLNLEKDVVEIKGDSQLVVNQVNGVWRCNVARLFKLKEEAKKLINGHKITWVPREQNQEADDLSKQAYALSKTKTEQWSERYKAAWLD